MSLKKHVYRAGAGFVRRESSRPLTQSSSRTRLPSPAKSSPRKPDAVVVDVGYTVFVVPRSSIVGITKTDTAVPAASVAAIPGTKVNVAPQFYYSDAAEFARTRREFARQTDRRGGRAGPHAGRPGLRLFHQRRRLSHHQFPRHRGRNGNFRGSLSPNGRPA